MKKLILTSLILSLFALAIQAQTLYTSYNGKNLNFVKAIAIDAQGNKWIGTSTALIMYDGFTWTEYTTSNSGLPSNEIASIAIDAKGNKWIGTNNAGLCKFDGNSWITYDISNNGFNSNPIRDISIDGKGMIWAAHYGLSKFDGNTWTHYKNQDIVPIGSIISVAVDNNGNIWAGSDYNEISKFDGTTWLKYNVGGIVKSDKVNDIAIDLQNNVWIATEYGGLSVFNGSLWKTFTTADGMSHNNVRCIVIDANGRKWVGAQGWINTFTDKFEGKFYSMYNSGIPVYAIAIDPEGKKWYGTSSGICYDSYQNALQLYAKVKIGMVFHDINGNRQKDAGEPTITGQIIKVDNNYTVSQKNGFFYSYLTNGTHTFTYRPQTTWKLTTDSTFTVTVTNSPISDTISIGVQRLDNIHDVETKITSFATRINSPSAYNLYYTNTGTLTENGSISLTVDHLVEIQQSSPVPDSIFGNRLVWKFSNLLPNEKRQILIEVKMPGVQYLGDTLVTTANITTGFAKETDSFRQILTGAYDPNDKSVKQGFGNKGYVLHGTELTYTLRFQNTGTDTAFNVNIRDSLSLNLNVQSLRILASSHPVRLDMNGQNEATFRFENILLPDSNVNPRGSNGFVTYAIKPKKNLPENTVIVNKGYIFFDFNPAIITNQTINTYVSVIPNIITGIKDTEVNEIIRLFPNPSRGIVHIHATQTGKLEISDISGRVMYNQSIDNNDQQIDISEIKSGAYLYRFMMQDKVMYGKIVKE